VAQVTSIERDRGREIGIVVILVVSVALLSAPTAFGAGDPVASGTLSFKRSSGFKHQLKSNHVKLKPKAFSIKVGSSVDPITGAGTLKLGKITFKKGNKKVVYGSAKATLGANGGKGNIKGSGGKVFSLSGGTVVRNGFGATVSGVKVKLLKGAAKKINRKLELHSLHKGSAGSLGVAEQRTHELWDVREVELAHHDRAARAHEVLRVQRLMVPGGERIGHEDRRAPGGRRPPRPSTRSARAPDQRRRSPRRTARSRRARGSRRAGRACERSRNRAVL